MNLTKTLSNLRTKPEGLRRRLAYVSALFICFIILIIWFSVAGSRIYQGSQAPAQTESSIASPFEAIKQEINLATQEISKGFNLLKENFKNAF